MIRVSGRPPEPQRVGRARPAEPARVAARATWDGAEAEPDYAAALQRAKLGAHFARLRLRTLLDSDAWQALGGTWEQLVRIGGLDASYLSEGERRLRHACAARRVATEAAARRVAALREAEKRAARATRLQARRQRRNRTPAQVEADKAKAAEQKRAAAESRRRAKEREKAERTPIQRAALKQEAKRRREARLREEEQKHEKRVRATREYEARRQAEERAPEASELARARPAWAAVEPRGGERRAAPPPRKQGAAIRKQACTSTGLGRQKRIAAIAAATGAAGAVEAAKRALCGVPVRAAGSPRGRMGALDAPT